VVDADVVEVPDIELPDRDLSGFLKGFRPWPWLCPSGLERNGNRDCEVTVEPLFMLAELDATEEESRVETSSLMMSRRWWALERRAKRSTLM
jgi:hypothetical protein